jgi:hypothetical protein
VRNRQVSGYSQISANRCGRGVETGQGFSSSGRSHCPGTPVVSTLAPSPCPLRSGRSDQLRYDQSPSVIVRTLDLSSCGELPGMAHFAQLPHRPLGIRQIEPDQSIPGGCSRRQTGTSQRAQRRRRRARPGCGDARRRNHRRRRQDQATGRCRPEADRPHTAIKPRHLYRSFRSRPQAFCGHETGARQAVRCGPILVQCCKGPMRNLPRGRVRVRSRAAVLGRQVDDDGLS